MAPLNNLTAVRFPATEYVAFETRLSRTKFVVKRYDKFLKGSVLDVGCYEAPLRSMLSGVVYMGIDIAGEPDQIVDLESVETLPFDEAQFQCVICIEVLEHLDAFHRVFNELIRVSSRYVIVSLPNCWCSARRQIEKGKGSISHYGLPVERPLDRHKWFINISQAKEFFVSKATGQLALMDLCIVEKPRNPFLRFYRKLVYSPECYANRYAHTLFAVYEKKPKVNDHTFKD